MGIVHANGDDSKCKNSVDYYIIPLNNKNVSQDYYNYYPKIRELTGISSSCHYAWCARGDIENRLKSNESYYSWANCSYLNNTLNKAYSNISQFFSASDRDTYRDAWPEAWRLRANINEKFPNDSQRKTEAYFCWANFYNSTNDNPLAYANLSNFFDYDKNYSYPDAFPDAWNLSANILNNRTDSQNETEACYYKAKYYDSISQSVDSRKKALEKIDEFLEGTSKKNITVFIDKKRNSGEILSDAWGLRARNLDATKWAERNLSDAYRSYYANISNKNDKRFDEAKNKLNISSQNGKNHTSDTLYLQGLIDLEENGVQDAADSFNSALKLNRTLIKNINIFNYKIIGDCLISAARNASDSRKSDDMSNGYYYLAKYYNDLNDIKDTNIANEKINKSIEMNFSNPDTWWLRGNILGKLNRHEAANYCFAYSEYLQKDWLEAHDYLKKPNMDDYIDKWSLNGSIFEREGNLSASYQAFKKSVEAGKPLFQERDESLSSAFLGLGRMEVLYNHTNYEYALKDFNLSLEHNATKFDAWINIGSALFNMGKIEEAQSIFNYDFDTTTNITKNEIYYNKKAEILASKGWYDASLSSLNDSFNRTKSYRRAWYNKGLAEINLKDNKNAIQDLDHALSLASGNDVDGKNITAKAWMNKAVANSSLHKYYDALIDVEHSIELNPSNETQIDAYYTKGLILLSLKQATEANQSFSMAININKSNPNPEALHGVGRARAMKNDLQGALLCYGKCTSADKNNEQAWIDKGTAEKLLGLKGESLISFHKALDAIKRNRARILCDIGYAWQRLPNDQRNLTKIKDNNYDLDRFNESIELDGSLADAYYNKSSVLFDRDPKNSTKALSILNQTPNINSSLVNDPKFNYLFGKILLKGNEKDKDNAYNRLIQSYNEAPYDINVLILLANNNNYKSKIYNSTILKGDKNSLIKILNSIKNIKESKSREYATPTISDLKLMLEKLNQSKKVESNLLLAIADSEYNLSLTDDAIQNYIKVRQTSESDEMDNIGKTIIKDLYLLSFILGLLYFILIILNLAEAKFVRLLILSNSIGFLALDYLLSRNFDASRAMWSLIVQCIIFSTSILFLIVIFKCRERKLLSMSEMALRNVVIGQIQCRKLFLLSFSFVLLSASLVFFYPREMEIINLNSFVIIRYFMALALMILILATVVPIGLALASGKVSNDLRRFFSVAQVTYIAICAVPLSWLFWSLGEPIGFQDIIAIEDKTIPIPWYTVTLLILFSLAFIYPYFKGYNEYNRWTSNTLDTLKELITEAEKSINDRDKSIDRKCSDLIDKIEKESKNEFPELGKLNDNDPMIIIPQISQEIAELTKESICKHNFHNVDLMDQISLKDPSCKDPFAALKKQITDLESKEINMSGISYYGCHSEYNSWILNMLTKQKGWVSEAENLINYTDKFCRKCSDLINDIEKGFEKEFPELRKANSNDTMFPQISQEIAELAKESKSEHNFHIGDPMDQMSSKDPFAELKKLISDLDPKEIDRSVVWTGYVSVLIAPAIALVISLIAPLMGIPMDQGNLSQLITNAVSQTTIGI